MNSWGDPDYSTLTQLTKTGYYTVDGTEINPAEGANNHINEGAFTYIQKQADGSYKYYLTLSINGYQDKSYCVIQAVADGPLGPYRKLTEEEIRECEAAINEKIRRSKQLKKEITEFINGIEDSLTRQVIFYRYIKGMTWGGVAYMTGGYNSEENVHKIAERYLKNHAG